MTYVGSPVTKATLPGDYDSQLRKIIFDMESVGVRHNDIIYPCSARPGKHEVMVQNGRLSLIDFGWATIDGQVPCNVSKLFFIRGWKPCPDSKILEVLKLISAQAGPLHNFETNKTLNTQNEPPPTDELHLILLWTPSRCQQAYTEALNTFNVVAVRSHQGYATTTEKIEYMNAFYESTRQHKDVNDVRGSIEHVVIFAKISSMEYGGCAGGASARGLKTCPPTNPFKNRVRNKHSGCVIHATDGVFETRANMRVLEYEYEHYNALHRPQWESLTHMFDHLNVINLSYVVSRNHEDYTKKNYLQSTKHPDVDFMVTDYNATIAALGALPSGLHATELGGHRVQHNVLIGGKSVHVDVRYVGDHYVDPNWMRDILRNRVARNGIFVMEAEDYFYSLLYHALIQKPQFGSDYKLRLMEMTSNSTAKSRLGGSRRDQCELLLGFMNDRGYISSKPDDPTVGFFPCGKTM